MSTNEPPPPPPPPAAPELPNAVDLFARMMGAPQLAEFVAYTYAVERIESADSLPVILNLSAFPQKAADYVCAALTSRKYTVTRGVGDRAHSFTVGFPPELQSRIEALFDARLPSAQETYDRVRALRDRIRDAMHLVAAAAKATAFPVEVVLRADNDVADGCIAALLDARYTAKGEQVGSGGKVRITFAPNADLMALMQRAVGGLR